MLPPPRLLAMAPNLATLREISRYGMLIAGAEKLGHDNVIRFLKANLSDLAC